MAHFIFLNYKIIMDGDYSQEFYFIYFIFLSFDSLVFFSFIFISYVSQSGEPTKGPGRGDFDGT